MPSSYTLSKYLNVTSVGNASVNSTSFKYISDKFCIVNVYAKSSPADIVVPVGTNYLYTGNFSNVIGIYPHNNDFEDTTCELILDIGTVFRINRKQIIIDKSGKKRIIYDVNVVNEYDIMN